jgi:hypothetical protein
MKSATSLLSLAGACLAVAIAWVTPACASRETQTLPAQRTSERDYPGLVRNPADVQGDFLWRQQIEAVHGRERRAGDIVVQKVGARLTVIGFAPFGARAFVLEQTGNDVRFEKYLGFELPVSPRVVLVDINRVFFSGAMRGPQLDGVHSFEEDGERTVEHWGGGCLLERTFMRPGGPPGEIRVRYEPGMRGIEPPAAVVLDNGWYGYRLRIETVEAAPL